MSAPAPSSLELLNPFDAFQFKTDPSESSEQRKDGIVATSSSKDGPRSIKILGGKRPLKYGETIESAVKKTVQVLAKKPGLSLSSDIAIGSASHFRIVINSLRSWKRTSNTLSSVDEYQVFLSGLSKIQTDFPFMVLCTGILASQCRDVVSMRVTKDLIASVGGDLTAPALCALSVESIESIVKSCNFYRSKAKALRNLATKVASLGNVPETFMGLTKLPGIGPKIANLCLSVAFKHDGDIVPIQTEDWCEEDLLPSSPFLSAAKKNKESEFESELVNLKTERDQNKIESSSLDVEIKTELNFKEERKERPSDSNAYQHEKDSGESYKEQFRSVKNVINERDCTDDSSDVSKSNIITENDKEMDTCINKIETSTKKHDTDTNTNSRDLLTSNTTTSGSSSNDNNSNKRDAIIDISSPGSGGTSGGIIVDTHVHKVSKRIGWSQDSKGPEGTRKILEDLAPADQWDELTVLLIGNVMLCSVV